MKSSLTEVIEATTPLFLAAVGAVIGVVVLVAPISDTRATAGFGLAGTAIAGAAGLARTGKGEQDFSVEKEGENLSIRTPQESETRS